MLRVVARSEGQAPMNAQETTDLAINLAWGGYLNLLLDLDMLLFSLPLPSLRDKLIIIQGQPLDQDQLVPLLLLPTLLAFMLVRLDQY